MTIITFEQKSFISILCNRNGDCSLDQDLRWGDSVPTNLGNFVIPYDSFLQFIQVHDSSLYGAYNIQILKSTDEGQNWTIEDTINVGSDFTITSMLASDNSINTSSAHGLSVNDKVKILGDGTGTIGTGLSEDTVYYVESVIDTDSVTLSATEGGAVIDITADSSGGNFYLTKYHGDFPNYIPDPDIEFANGDHLRIRFIHVNTTISYPQVVFDLKEI